MIGGLESSRLTVMCLKVPLVPVLLVNSYLWLLFAFFNFNILGNIHISLGIWDIYHAIFL